MRVSEVESLSFLSLYFDSEIVRGLILDFQSFGSVIYAYTGCPKQNTRKVWLTTEQKAFVQLSNFLLMSIENTLT